MSSLASALKAKTFKLKFAHLYSSSSFLVRAQVQALLKFKVGALLRFKFYSGQCRPRSPWARFLGSGMVRMHAAKGKTYDNYYKLVDTGDLYLGRENSPQVLRVLTSSPAIQTVGQSNGSQRLVVIDPLEWCVLRWLRVVSSVWITTRTYLLVCLR
ncbi:hypothetical protein R3P38DRAFT_3238004 [Favolaschia claudopus]|uniref:Uncharacterized protein n=1 Tax=Favolaschia claudopus TaxID=2862362 RepID=A0AAV9Z9R3_9AGAR